MLNLQNESDRIIVAKCITIIFDKTKNKGYTDIFPEFTGTDNPNEIKS